MEIFWLLLIVAAVFGGLMWNKRNTAAAIQGVRFTLPHPPQIVSSAVRDAHCGGAWAATRSAISGVRVSPSGPDSFHVESRFGDVATIEVQPAAQGSLIRARAAELYVGSPPKTQFRRGIMGLSAAIMHGIFVMLGVRPGAARLARFQRGIEGRTVRQLQRSTQS